MLQRLLTEFLKVKGMTPSAYREAARKDLLPQLERQT